MEPETRYARSGEVSIAYQVTGDGPFDVVYVTPMASHVELAWTVPAIAAYFRSIASFCRLIRFDKRGTGMSDRVSGVPSLETRMDDVRAVMDAAGSDCAALIGQSEGGPMSILFGATYPSRTWALVLEGSFARTRWAHDYPWGRRDEEQARQVAETERLWGTAEYMEQYARGAAPSADEENRRALETMFRQSASPGSAAALRRMNGEIDVRHVLSAVRVPTLILNRSEESPFIVNGSRFLAANIPGARHVELPGADHALFAAQPELTLAEIEAFLREAWDDRTLDDEPDRVLATILFTDIVGSTARAIELGDARWREALKPTTLSFAGSSAVFGGESSTRLATGSSPRSTARRARSVARARSRSPFEISVWRSAPAFTRASARSSTARWAASQSTSGRGSPRTPRPARLSSRAR